MINTEYELMKKKKNIIIIFISFSFSLLLGLCLFLYLSESVSDNIAIPVIFIIVVLYLFLIIYLRSKLVYYLMRYDYLRMVTENLGNLNVKKKLYTKSWISNIESNGFKKFIETDEYILYYQFIKKIPRFGKTGQLLINMIVSKIEDIDFYKKEINDHFEKIYNSYEDEKKVKKQIVLQFVKHESYSDDKKEKLQEIINYKNGEQVLIHLSVGYFVNENQVYFLRPIKKYPNKYYFYACNLANEFSYVKEV